MRTFRTLASPDVPVPPVAALSSGLDAGVWVFVTGQLAWTPGHTRVEGSAREQAERVMERLGSLLGSAGLGFEDVVRTTLYLTRMEDLEEVNAAYAARLTPPYPARVTLAVAALAVPGARVEIDAIALRPSRP